MALDPALREPSGLVASATQANVFWAHGDSGRGNWLFAVDRHGRLLGRYRVRGAHNVDWEDITRDDAGDLWLGDIGNNMGGRRDLGVYRLHEPELGERGEVGEVEVAQRVGFFYPEQHEYGVKRHNFDAESLMWWGGRLWLLTKHRGDMRTVLYRFPVLAGLPKDARVALERVASFDLGAQLGASPSAYPGQATAADVAPDGAHWALLSYDAALIFALPDPASKREDLLARPVNRVEFDPSVTRQIEALAWDGDALLLCNEEGAVFRITEPLKAASYP